MNLYCELVVTGDLPVGVFAINVVMERGSVGQDLVARRTAEALPLLDVAEAKVPPEVVAHLDHHAAQQADERAVLRLLHLIVDQIVHLLDFVQL